ncbi:hypothetical protein BDV96DRAFT_34975 [Lophiotrema nucula]|uniref:Rhodopsin domain-containing protein n=1 Tax=Lophiotrema nucula TaxID=690887 RepID=A0A6A5ZCM0_9PLEO|nr:hypothetical protein BDV96DRAFT_34975 [Lophiotrema nucula]
MSPTVMAATTQPRYSDSYLKEYNGDQVVACCVVFVVLETFFVTLRFIARHVKKVSWGWDDALVVSATIFSFGVIASCLVDVYAGGAGHHLAYVKMHSPERLETWAKMTLVIPLMYLPAVALPKLSINALYLRIFSDRMNRVVCWIITGLVVANCIGSMVAAFVACVPLEFLWNRKLPGGGHCIDFNAWYRWGSLMNIFTDVVMLVVPIPVMLNLQASVKMKIGLILTFGVGSIGLVTAIIRFVGFFSEDMAADGTWTATRLMILSVMEPGFYLLASCLVCLKPLLARVRDWMPLSQRSTVTDRWTEINVYRMTKVENKITSSSSAATDRC